MFRVVRMVNPMAVKVDSYPLKLFNPETFIRYLLSFPNMPLKQHQFRLLQDWVFGLKMIITSSSQLGMSLGGLATTLPE